MALFGPDYVRRVPKKPTPKKRRSMTKKQEQILRDWSSIYYDVGAGFVPDSDQLEFLGTCLITGWVKVLGDWEAWREYRYRVTEHGRGALAKLERTSPPKAGV